MSVWQAAVNALLSVAIGAAAVFAAWAMRRSVKWAAHRLPGPPSADRAESMGRLIRMATWTIRPLCGLVAVVAILNVWGLDVVAGASTGVGRAAVAHALHLLVIFALAVGGFELAGLTVGRLFSGVAEGALEVRRQAQLKTLGPLLQGIAQTAIVLLAALMALSEIGVQIGPLIAGAGVIGVALGFGAQTLVKDFLTGVFLIVEDTVSVGDVVQIGGFGGVVEHMSLRTIRLRDFDGTLHVFPYSEAQVVHNMTKTFSYYVFNLQISYSSEIDEALGIMRSVGGELQADPEFADRILEPIEVVGVDQLGDSGVVLKARIKTLPLHQWAVGREYNRRIKLAFDRAGIEIPFPHMKVVLPEGQRPEVAAHA